jgi:hypothetical protein
MSGHDLPRSSAIARGALQRTSWRRRRSPALPTVWPRGSAMQEALDPFPLLQFLQDRGVEHIIVGGIAVNAHGFIRATKDIDIVPDPSPKNLEALAEALRDVEATIVGMDDFGPEELPMDPTRTEDLLQGGNFCVITTLGRVDVMQWLDGLETEDLYAKLDADALDDDVNGLKVRVCSLEHLLAMKRVAGRVQDLEDIKHLQVDAPQTKGAAGRPRIWKTPNG